jgi:hypothetical protein
MRVGLSLLQRLGRQLYCGVELVLQVRGHGAGGQYRL